MPERVLDLLSAASCGKPYKHLLDRILPVEAPALSRAAEKLMTKEAVQARVSDAVVDLARIAPADALSIATGVFVSLTLNLVKSSGRDLNCKIEIDGGANRDITIGAPKDTSPHSAERVGLSARIG
jgi:hypothetical protein